MLKPIKVSGDPACIRYWNARELPGPPDERVLFGNNQTLQNVLVHITDGLAEDRDKAPPKEPVVLRQIHCQYVPHITVVQTNQALHITNEDETLHNLFAVPRSNPAFGDGMPVKGQFLVKRYPNPEIGLRVSCSVHLWMLAYIHILDHPYHDVTGESGTFEITNVPPGEYELSVWHEFKRFKPDQETIKVRVEAGKATKAAFTYRVKPRGE